MAFSLETFVELRPFAFHVTREANVASLADSMMLRPAAEILLAGGLPELVRSRREEAVTVRLEGQELVINDQRPLILKNAKLSPVWSSGDFIEFLNQHVFFWPGGKGKPGGYGERYWSHYEKEGSAVLRMATGSLFAANKEREPLFCAYNSGALRMQWGKPVARGPDLFQPAGSFPFTAGRARELVFLGRVFLPPSTEVRLHDSSWRPMRPPPQ